MKRPLKNTAVDRKTFALVLNEVERVGSEMSPCRLQFVAYLRHQAGSCSVRTCLHHGLLTVRKTESFFSVALKDAIFLTKYPRLSCDLHRMTSVWMVSCQPWLRHYKKAVFFYEG